jgi:hypothetical protein
VRLASISLAFALASGCYQSHETRRDGGPSIDTGGIIACDEETLPAYAGPPCSTAVTACRDACGADEPCRDACLDETCHDCIYATIFHCANEAGCLPAWRDFACCVESAPGCGALRGFDRTTCATSCPMQFEPYATCIEATGGMPCFLEAARRCGLH